MYIDSKAWIYLFLFYGTLCFIMGFSGYLLKTDKGAAVSLEKSPRGQPQNPKGHNPAAETEKYLTKFVTGLHSAISNGLQNGSTKAGHNRISDEAIPVSAGLPLPPLVFCYPDTFSSGVFRQLISRCRLHLKADFTGFEEILIGAQDHWEEKLAVIVSRKPPPFLIGLNLTGSLAGDGFEKAAAGVGVHLYFSVPQPWQSYFLAQITPEFSNCFNSFTMEKHVYGNGEIYKVTWKEDLGENLTGLSRNLEIVAKALAQICCLQKAKKI